MCLKLVASCRKCKVNTIQIFTLQLAASYVAGVILRTCALFTLLNI